MTGRPRFLVAIDIDGTLLRADGEIARNDRKAIGRAVAAGCAVTLATGRLSPNTIPMASDLGLVHPVICADGGAIIDPTTTEIIAVQAIERAFVTDTLSRFRDGGLSPFVFTHEAIHGDVKDVKRAPYLAKWSENIEGRRNFDGFMASDDAPQTIIVLGTGDEADVRGTHDQLALQPGRGLEIASFPVGRTKTWALRVIRGDCSKGTALAHLAGLMDLQADSVAAIGDWYNDISMLEWAEHSFAMGQAPEDVQDAANECLLATDKTGGGVAEMINHLLG